MNQLIAYIKLIESGKIDEIINMIKKQNTVDENALIEFLIKKVNLNDLQAKFILGTDIKRLSKGYLQKYKAEAAEISKEIDRYEKIVYGDGSDILKEIDQELLDIEKKYGSPRICKVLKESEDNNIPQGIFKVVITRRNFIRKIPDVDKIGVVKGDDPKFILKVDNTENILLFDNKGKVFKLPVSKIPLTDKNSLGTDIRILCKNLTADIIALYYEPMLKKIVEGTHKHYLTIVTKDNSIKKLDMEDFLNVSSSGLIYTKLKDNSDEVTGITIAPAELDVVIYSQQKALRTSMKNIPLFKRNAAGNKAMNTNSDIEGLSVIYPKTDYIIVITSKGRINKFPITAFNSHDRARSGVNVIKLKQGDSIKVIFGANDTDAIRIVTSNSVVEIPVNSVDVRSTVATGEVIPQLKGSTIVRCDLMWNK
jgi:DNA gyrase subunit A